MLGGPHSLPHTSLAERTLHICSAKCPVSINPIEDALGPS